MVPSCGDSGVSQTTRVCDLESVRHAQRRRGKLTLVPVPRITEKGLWGVGGPLPLLWLAGRLSVQLDAGLGRSLGDVGHIDW